MTATGPKRIVYWLIILSLFVASCGGNGGADNDVTTTSEGSEEPMVANSQAALDDVDAALEGLDAEVRRARLTELALEEGGEVSFYTTQSIEDILPALEAFEDATEITVNVYRAGGTTVVNRLIQEAAAGYSGADLFLSDQVFIVGLEDEGLLLDLDSPVREDILDFVNFSDKWVGTWLNAYIATWNTNLVSPEAAPTTWEEVFSNFPGDIAVDPSDSDLFMTLVDDYFIARLGMTEEETVEFFKKGLADGFSIRGHTVGNELHMAGEFAVHATQNITRVHDNEVAGAPFGWQPPVQPLVARGSGAGILSTTEKPASALLLLEFFLTDGQTIMAEVGLAPANETIEVSTGISEDWEVIPLDVEKYSSEEEKWVALWEEVLRDAGASSTE